MTAMPAVARDAEWCAEPDADAPKPRHELSGIDPETKTAWCAACGARVDATKGRRAAGWQCAPANRQRTAEWRRAHPDKVEATKAAYKTADPAKYKRQKLARSRRYADAHRQEMRDQANAVREQLRAEIIAAYGGRCNCPGCHVRHAVLLTVDHVNGGARHRQNRRSTRDIYRQIKKLGFPSDYQLLCGSCNLAKSDKDKCPLAGEGH